MIPVIYSKKWHRPRLYGSMDSWQFYYNYVKKNSYNPKLLINRTGDTKMPAIGVSGNTYVLSAPDGRTTVHSTYEKLVQMAKEELRFNKLPDNVNIKLTSDRDKLKGELKKYLYDYMVEFNKTMGASANKRLSANTMKSISKDVSKELLFPNRSGKLTLDETDKQMFGYLFGGVEGQQSIYELEKSFEDALQNIGNKIAYEAKESIIDSITHGIFSGKNITVKRNRGVSIRQNSRAVTSATVSGIKINTTQNGKTSFHLKVSVEDMYKQEHKIGKTSDDNLIAVANWSNLLKQFLGWSSMNGVFYEYNFDELIIATFASILIGGYAGKDRSLIMLDSTASSVSIRSLDVALRDAERAKRFHMSDVKIGRTGDYIENARELAAARGMHPNEIYGLYKEKSSRFRDISLSFRIG